MWPIDEYAISRLILVCPIAAKLPSNIDAIDTMTTSSLPRSDQRRERRAHHSQQQRHCGNLGGGREEYRHRRWGALVDIRRPHVERHGGHLERQPDKHEHDADDQARRGALRLY